MRLIQIFAAAAIALVSTFAVADDAADKAIRKSLENLQLEVPVESITASPLPGLYEVKLKGSRVLYASADGQYVVQGYLFQLPKPWFIRPLAKPNRTSPCSPTPLARTATNCTPKCLS
jgi:protein-disulfide isomerase